MINLHVIKIAIKSQNKQIKKNIQLKKKVLIEKIKSPKNGFTYSYDYTNLIDKSLIDLINYIDPKDPTNNCLDVAIITDPKLRTKKTIKKLKYVAGRVLEKK